MYVPPRRLAALSAFIGLTLGFCIFPTVISAHGAHFSTPTISAGLSETPVVERTRNLTLEAGLRLAHGNALRVKTVKIDDASLEKWLSDAGPALIKSFAPKAFPGVLASQIAEFEIGTPVKVYQFGKALGPDGFPLITETSLRVAPISDAQGNAVGVIQVELDTESVGTRKVIGDAKLGQRLLPPPANAEQRPDPETLIYDSSLKAWFAVKGKSIEAASASGEKIVLGSVPLAVFLAQRSVIVSDGETAVSIEKQADSSPQMQESRLTLGMIATLVFMTSLFAISIAWLIWESRFELKRPLAAADAIWNWATGYRRAARFKGPDAKEQKVKFSESGGEVLLIKNPLKKHSAQKNNRNAGNSRHESTEVRDLGGDY